MTVVATDDFNRANGGVGANWTTHGGYTGPVIASNVIQSSGGVDYAATYNAANAGTDDMYVKADSTVSTANVDNDIIVWCRMPNDATETGYQGDAPTFRNTPGRLWSLQRATNGVFTVLAVPADSAPVGVGTRSLQIQAVGTTISILQDGVTLGSVSDSTHSGATKRFGGFHVFADTTGFCSLDNWEMGNFISAGGLSTAQLRLTPPGFISPMGDWNPWMGSSGGGISATAYLQNLAGNVTPTGQPHDAVTIARAGTVTPSGIVAKAPQIARSGSITPTGALARLGQLARGGTVTPSGVIARAVTLTRGGATAPTGQPHELVTMARGGGVTPTGTLAAIRAFLLGLAGSVTSTGAVTKATTIARTGGTTPTGALRRAVLIARVGTVTPIGALSAIRAFLLALAGAVTPTGALAKQAQLPRGGSVTAGGTLRKAVSVTRGGTVSPAGALRKAISIIRTGVITAVGTIANVFTSGGPGTDHAGAATLVALGPDAELEALTQPTATLTVLAASATLTALEA